MNSGSLSAEELGPYLPENLRQQVFNLQMMVAQRDATITELQAACAVLVEALRMTQSVLAFYAVPVGSDIDGSPISVPDFYDELEFGEAAKEALTKIKPICSNLPASAAAHIAEVAETKARLAGHITGLESACEKITRKNKHIEYYRSRAEAAEARAKVLEANQRTPGTVEVCSECGINLARLDGRCGNYTGDKIVQRCPIRSASEVTK